MLSVLYQLWRIDTGQVYAVRLEQCEPYVLGNDEAHVEMTDKVTGYVGPMSDSELAYLNASELSDLAFRTHPNSDGIDPIALELDVLRPDAECLAEQECRLES